MILIWVDPPLLPGAMVASETVVLQTARGGGQGLIAGGGAVALCRMMGSPISATEQVAANLIALPVVITGNRAPAQRGAPAQRTTLE